MSARGRCGPPVDDRPPVAPEDASRRERLRLLRADSRRRLRGTAGRGRKLRGLLELLRPYRGRVVALMFVALAHRRRRRRWRPPRSPTKAIDDGIIAGDRPR